MLDRLKDVINRGGCKVFCSEVEAVLTQHPAVAESAVLGERETWAITTAALPRNANGKVMKRALREAR